MGQELSGPRLALPHEIDLPKPSSDLSALAKAAAVGAAILPTAANAARVRAAARSQGLSSAARQAATSLADQTGVSQTLSDLAVLDSELTALLGSEEALAAAAAA